MGWLGGLNCLPGREEHLPSLAKPQADCADAIDGEGGLLLTAQIRAKRSCKRPPIWSFWN
jgi:hypothetical protein